MDAGYFTAALCHLTQERAITLVPGYWRPNKVQNGYQKKLFRYDPEKDECRCPARAKYTTNRQMQKTITRHGWEELKEKANALRLTK